MEEQIAHLRAELLHREQETQRVQLQLVKEKEERERAERKVGPSRTLRVGPDHLRPRLSQGRGWGA